MTNFLTHSVWAWITGGAALVGLAAALWFVIRLQMEAGWDWRRNPFGRYLMTRKLLLAALFILIIMNRVGPDWWGELVRPPLTAVLMTAFALQTFVPYRLLMKAQTQAHHDDQEARR